MGKKFQDKWLGNYTLGGYHTLSMSPDPEKLEQLSNQKGHLLEVLRDDKYFQAEPVKQTVVQDRPITHRISQVASWRLCYSSFFDYLEKSSDKKSLSVKTAAAGRISATASAQASTVFHGVVKAGAGDSSNKQSSSAKTATAGTTSATKLALLYVPQGSDKSAREKFCTGQDIRDLLNPPEDMSILTGMTGLCHYEQDGANASWTHNESHMHAHSPTHQGKGEGKGRRPSAKSRKAEDNDRPSAKSSKAEDNDNDEISFLAAEQRKHRGMKRIKMQLE